jgi:hypothetical protein
MAQAVGRRTPNAEVCFRNQISVCGIVVDCDRFFYTFFGFPLSLLFNCHLILMYYLRDEQ